MSEKVDRRMVLKGAAAAVAGMATPDVASASWTDGLTLGEPVPFSFDAFKNQARLLAKAPYAGPPRPAPDIVQKINYEEWGKIKFRDDHAIFAEGL